MAKVRRDEFLVRASETTVNWYGKIATQFGMSRNAVVVKVLDEFKKQAEKMPPEILKEVIKNEG